MAGSRLARRIGLALAIGAPGVPAGAQLVPVEFRAANPGEVPVDTKRMFESLSGQAPLNYGGGNNVAQLSSSYGIASNFIVGIRPWQVYEPQNVTCELVVQLDMNNDGLWDRYAELPGPGRPGYNENVLITHSWQYPEPTYPSMGSHNIRWRIQERAPIGSYCSQVVATVTTGYAPVHTLPTPSTAPGACDVHLELSPPTPEPSALIGYRSLDGVLDRPLVIVEGLDATNTTYPAKYLGMMLTRPNGSEPSMQDALLQHGFDVYALNLGNANRNVRENAMVLLGALLDLRDRLALECHSPGCDPRPIRVLGLSMGGVLARYALAWAEANGIDHGCDMFVSFDAPHQGAWANVDFQQWLYYNAGSNPTMAMLADLLDNPAALELLTFNVFDPVLTLPAPHPPSIQQQFLDEINALNGGGYPRRTRNIGVANGYADLDERVVVPLYSNTIVGSLAIATYTIWVNGIVFSQRVIRFEGGDIQGGSLQPSFKPSNDEGVVFSFDGKFLFFPVADPLEIRYSVDIGTWGAPAFIPVRSALDLRGVELAGPFGEGILGWESSGFDEIYAPADRPYWHDEVPALTAQYLIGKLCEGPQFYMPTIVSPGTGSTYGAGSSMPITWEFGGLQSGVRVTLAVRPVGGAWQEIHTDSIDVVAPSHTFLWTVPPGDGEYEVRLETSHPVAGVEADTVGFSVATQTVLAPVAGQVHASGNDLSVEWQWMPGVSVVDIAVSTDGGQSFAWNLPGIPNSYCGGRGCYVLQNFAGEGSNFVVQVTSHYAGSWITSTQQSGAFSAWDIDENSIRPSVTARCPGNKLMLQVEWETTMPTEGADQLELWRPSAAPCNGTPTHVVTAPSRGTLHRVLYSGPCEAGTWVVVVKSTKAGGTSRSNCNVIVVNGCAACTQCPAPGCALE